MKKIYKCGCKKDKGHVTIDTSASTAKYGISGLVDMYDCRLGNGEVICNKCKEVIYKYKDVRRKNNNETK